MKGNPELETTRHMKNCINFIRRHKNCRVWDVSLSHYPSQHLRVFCHLTRLYFAKHATTMSPQSLIELICGLTGRQESSCRNTTNPNFKKISPKISCFKQLPLMQNIKMPLNIFLDVPLDWLLVCQFILTMKNKSVKLPLETNKQKYHATFICKKTRNLIAKHASDIMTQTRLRQTNWNGG